MGFSTVTVAPADVWTVTTRSLAIPTIDDNYISTSVATPATINTYSSWIEILSNVGTGKRLYGVFVYSPDTLTASNKVEFEFGEGASGSEAAVTRAVLVGASVKTSIFVPLYKSLTDNARLSVRAKCSIASLTFYVAVMIA